MRADRLVATLLLMQARGRVTAAELAAELEISVATARRDLEALSAAGVPVYPQPGRGGGWQLVGGARTDLSGLSAREAQALFLLAGPAAAGSPEVKSALRKLMGALPGTFRADAEAAADAVVVDQAGWGEHPKDRPPMVSLLRDAVIARQQVLLTYAGRERSERLVDPWGLVDKDDVWYLVAGTAKGRRTFRVDRIVAATPTGDAADRPSDLELAQVWREVVEEVEQRRSLLSAHVVLDRRYFGVLRGRFGRHCELVAELPGNRVRARVAAPAPIMIAQELAGWGALVDVEDPESVRAELARLGAELVARYAR
ncbi:helix-turn-helix transcriptional regulator [Amycolatopsis vancoresmycina]|uniref:HTH type 11 transcriptional regulator n=1 Tax=Amycolatopsis vancoresmycina DSM 44592 TaxID=1292037 RepID=R1I740_9PSEU|nr:WYL domain-containing protein [Amycolatopsis vancoresmycina]EOD68351.1 HTH type 11 transcriptional regulator [Amycolatopsis vancoresmycina DSM 44592]